MPLSPELIEGIKAKADIVEVISAYLDVQKKGSNYVALCPFHHDTNPSMMISPSKQIFKCFVCGTSGNVFGFVSKYEKVDFLTSVRKVCEICHIPVPAQLSQHSRPPREHESVYAALKKLSDFYCYMLNTNEGKAAKDYLRGRGLSDDVISHFRLGYAPADQTQSISYLREREKIDVATLDAAGIISAASSALTDRYRDRVMFPLSDIRGNLVGFSGRRFAEGNSDAKYINSPETVVFRKSELLYNFDNASATVRKDRFVYVLEGFMDVIALYRAGISSAVALMGTALTKEHIGLFRHLGVEIRLCLDSDEPGQAATEKALRLLAPSGLSVRVVKPLTDGKDPDELLKAEGPEALQAAMLELELPLLHSLNRALALHELSDYEAKERFLEEQRVYFAAAPDLAKDDMLARLSAGLGVVPEAVRNVVAAKESRPAAEEPPFYIQETAESEEDEAAMSRREVNNDLERYVLLSLGPKPHLSVTMKRIIRTETQIFSRLTIMRGFSLFRDSHQIFLVDEYGRLFMIMSDFYAGLHNGVDYLREEEFSRLDDYVESYYSERLDELRKNQGSEADIRAANANYRIALGLVSRLKNCRYPSRKIEEKEFRDLLSRHLEQLEQNDRETGRDASYKL